MTRKQALLQTMELIRHNRALAPEMKGELLHKLFEIASELPLKGWSERSIHDTIQQWAIEHGRNPTCSDLKQKPLPPHPVIEYHFKMKSKEFLKKYYPQPEKCCDSKAFGHKTKQQWLDVFREEYQRIKPSNAGGYNACRQAGTPTWATVARLFGLKRWLELLELAGLEKYPAKERKESRTLRIQCYFKQKGSSDPFLVIQQTLKKING